MNTNTITPLICSECGEGNYYTDTFARFDCACGHYITLSDVVLDEGESLTTMDGVVAVVTPA